MDPALALGIYATVVSTLLLLIEVARFRREGRQEQRQLTLKLSNSLPVGAATDMLGDNWILVLTAANVGDRPVGVDGLALLLTDGQTVPGIARWPNAKQLPSVLQPGETAATWWVLEPLRSQLRLEGLRLKAARANLHDGTSITQELPAQWARFTDAE